MDGTLSSVLELAGKASGFIGAAFGAYAVFAKRERKEGLHDFRVGDHEARLEKLENDMTKSNATILLHTDLHRRYEAASATVDRKMDDLLRGQSEIRGIVRRERD